ncbi:MAG TPA: S9 family peptidase [Verrucomicrobiae bacterium]|jgi:dipeptidyl aminopeptidase/acylaminoacyl peptidase|nr:S9 family peptidase [Verrucomicrobiae bacterium]
MPRIVCVFCFATASFLAATAQIDTHLRATDPKAVESLNNPAATAISIDDLFYTRSISGSAWSPDGEEIAVITNLTGRMNLWKVSSSGGWPIQMAQSDDAQYAPTFSPDGKWIVYQQDKGGNEQYDLYAIPVRGGQSINLTNTPDVRETAARFSPDGKWIVFNAKTSKSPSTNVMVMDWQTHAVRALTNETDPKRYWNRICWSHDGRYVFAARMENSFADSDVYRIDATTGRSENLTPHSGRVLNSASGLSPNDDRLLISSNDGVEHSRVGILHLKTHKVKWLTHGEWDATPGDWSPDGRVFTYSVNQDSREDVYLVDTASLKASKLRGLEGLNSLETDPSAFSPDSKKLLVLHESSRQPADLWLYNLGSNSGTQLTHSAIASIDPDYVPPSEIVHYKSFDGTVISAILWIPFNLKRDQTNPAIVIPHGGPTGQTLDRWNPTAAALTSRGYVCLAPNVRGSTGYGMPFQRANYQDLGGGDLQDEIFAVKFLEQTGYLDSKRVGITGGSYGGFMTLMAVSKTPDVWAAGVAAFGVSNWRTMLTHADPFLQEYVKGLLGTPEHDAAVYDKTSVMNYVSGEKAPLLLLQGENDIRVPKEEAEQIVDTLRAKGNTVDVHYYPQEGHGWRKREDQIDALRRTVKWFDRYLEASPTASGSEPSPAQH